MKLRAFTVTEINAYMKRLFDYEPILSHVTVEGELSNVKFHQSGHVYFSLKDDLSRVPAVIFKRDLERLDFLPVEGQRVKAKGKMSLFDKEGKLTFYVHGLEPIGLGDEFAAFEALKRELTELGWFDPRNKKKIPEFAERVAVITSPTGAVIRDILTVSGRRTGLTHFCVFPTLVQGADAIPALVQAIQQADLLHFDAIIIARGGGSLEDLMPFNARAVAEAVFKANTPIISAVGHETDFTICDFTADLRASTPSAAAELVTVDQRQLERELETLSGMMNQQITWRLKRNREAIESISPTKRYAYMMMQIATASDQLNHEFGQTEKRVKQVIHENTTQLNHLSQMLHQLSPLNTLDRGYALAETQDHTLIDSIRKVQQGDSIALTVKDGKINCTVDTFDERRITWPAKN